MKLWIFLVLLMGIQAKAGVEFSEVRLSDGTTIQTCARFPDPHQFPGPRPALMLIMGSGSADTCRTRVGTAGFLERLAEKGFVGFLRQKRGLRHDPITGSYTINVAEYRQADFPHLKSDTLEALEFYPQRSPSRFK